MNCAWCDEPVLEGEQSIANAPMHRECLVRSIVGSAAHLMRKCSCYIPGATDGDDPKLTKREAAAAACVLNVRLRRCTDTANPTGASIDGLELSPRAYNALYFHAKIRTMEQLTARTKWQLLSVKNFGKVSLAEVETLLARRGLKLREGSRWE